MVLHDINQAAFYADRVVALKAGAVFADGTPREMIAPGTVCSLLERMSRLFLVQMVTARTVFRKGG